MKKEQKEKIWSVFRLDTFQIFLVFVFFASFIWGITDGVKFVEIALFGIGFYVLLLLFEKINSNDDDPIIIQQLRKGKRTTRKDVGRRIKRKYKTK